MDWINEIIEGLFDLYGTSDPFDLCDQLDIRLVKVGRESPILKGQSCVYHRYLGNREYILYAAGLRFKRLEFYILHELGHALLHPDLTCSALTNNGKLERQANYFAGRLMLYGGLERTEGLTVEYAALENDIPMSVMEDFI